MNEAPLKRVCGKTTKILVYQVSVNNYFASKLNSVALNGNFILLEWNIIELNYFLSLLIKFAFNFNRAMTFVRNISTDLVRCAVRYNGDFAVPGFLKSGFSIIHFTVTLVGVKNSVRYTGDVSISGFHSICNIKDQGVYNRVS